MKPLFSFCLFFLALSNLASAALRAPLPSYFNWADAAYLVRVRSVEKDKITFTITETLRGKTVTVLILTRAGEEEFKPNSEWLLISCVHGEQNKDQVGWLMDGYCGWLPTPAVRDNGEIYVQDLDWTSSKAILDKAPDGTRGFTLDHIKKLLQEHPFKP